MIHITPELSLYPPRAPLAPWFWWWWTVLSWVLIWWLRRYRRITSQKKNAVLQPQTIEPEYTYNNWLHDLQQIATSIRTPEQKARALLIHLFRYYGIHRDETLIPSLTQEELLIIPEIQPLLPYFQELYEMIFSGRKITHATIKTFTTNLMNTLPWT